jgi:hypothetical protein
MVDHSYHNNHGHDRGRRKKEEQDRQKEGKATSDKQGGSLGRKRKEKCLDAEEEKQVPIEKYSEPI